MNQNEEINSINSDLIRGHIDTIILKALQAGDRYGYDIIKEIEHKSGGQYVIKQPTLYSCLKRLEVQGFVKSYWGTKSIGGRKKYFTLTELGKELFLRNKSDWDYSRDVINKLISDDDYSAAYPAQTDNVEENDTAMETPVIASEDMPSNESDNENEIVSENDEESEPPIINADTYNAVVNEATEEEELIETEITDDGYKQLSLFDINEEPLPLSDTEQNQNVIDSVIEDDKTDFIDEVYGKQSQESYLSNVGNAKYEPPQSNDIIDVNDYFTDINEYDYSEEETAASAASMNEEDPAIILPPPEPEAQPEPIVDDGIVLPPEPEEPETVSEVLSDDAVVLPMQELPQDEPVEDDAVVLPMQELPQDEPVEDDAVVLPMQELPQEEPVEDDAVVLPMQDDSPSIINDDAKILPPPDEEEQYGDAKILPREEEVDNDLKVEERSEEKNDAVVLPMQELPSEDTQKSDNKTIFLGYNDSLSDLNENASIIDKEYRDVINKLISDNIVNSDFEQQPVKDIDYTNVKYYKQEEKPQNNDLPLIEEEPPVIREPIEERPTEPVKEEIDQSNNYVSETKNDVDLRVHNQNTVKSYNNKHYYYSNRLRLLQCGILFAIMILEIAICFYSIEVVHNGMKITSLNLALYIIAVAIAALFPIVSFFMASSNYYKRKRINYSGRSSAIFSVSATLLLSLIVFFANVYGGLLIKDINNYLSSLIMPIVLSTNVIVNAIIFHCLYKSGKYNVNEEDLK